MVNKKGMTLIELIVVMIIISLILLFAFPVIDRLIITSGEQKYEYYYDIIKEGALTYSENKVDALGSITDRGCIEVDLDYLVARQFITSFEDETINCGGKARITNNTGKKEVTVNLSCMNTKESNKVVYEKNEVPDTTCSEFSPQGDLTILESIKNNPLGEGTTYVTGNNTYIRGENPNNYVWYSGKLWRIYNYSSTSHNVGGYVKMISEDAITVLPYEYGAVDDIFAWYNSSFIDTIKDKEDYLENISWNKADTTESGYVGLITNSEVTAVGSGSYLTSDSKYLVVNSSSNGKVYTYSDALSTSSTKTFVGIRPVVALSSDLIVTNGTGSYDSPYILEGNSGNVAGNTKINTRYSGEYVKIENQIYRIVRIVENGSSSKITKITSLDPIVTINFNETNDTYYLDQSTLLSDYLNPWFNKQTNNFKSLFTYGKWLQREINDSSDFVVGMTATLSYGIRVGLPELQEIYSSNFTNSDYNILTMTPHSTNYVSPDTTNTYKVNVIKADNTIGTQKVTKVDASVRISMYLDDDVYIKSGNGTQTNPYVLAK